MRQKINGKCTYNNTCDVWATLAPGINICLSLFSEQQEVLTLESEKC